MIPTNLGSELYPHWAWEDNLKPIFQTSCNARAGIFMLFEMMSLLLIGSAVSKSKYCIKY